MPVDPIIEGGQVINSTLGSSLTLEKQVNVLNDVKSKHIEPTGNRFSGAELKISGEKVDQSGGARKQQKNKQVSEVSKWPSEATTLAILQAFNMNTNGYSWSNPEILCQELGPQID